MTTHSDCSFEHKICRYEITKEGSTAALLNLGATLQSLHFAGIAHSVVLGSSNLDTYSDCLKYAGAIVGPIANRIADSSFKLGVQRIEVSKNFLGRHCLHGGNDSPSERAWQLLDHQLDQITFALELADGENGFPGPARAEVRYHLQTEAILDIYIQVINSKLSACNWTHHSYFNLDGTDNLNSHQLQVFADRYLPVDDELIPTGEILSVENSEFDFKATRSLAGQSIDHNFCIAQSRSPELRKHAMLHSTASGVSLLVESTEPGLQVYTGDHLKDEPCNSTLKLAGIALEPQGWPDAPNHPGFPSVEIPAGITYQHHMRFTFTV